MFGRVDTFPCMDARFPALTAADFTDLRLARDGAWLVDFTAAWCPPCRVLERSLPAVAGRVHVAQVDTDVEVALAARFDVRAMPTLILFVDGQVRATRIGALAPAALERWVTDALGSTVGAWRPGTRSDST
jgi:thioredoxin 1